MATAATHEEKTIPVSSDTNTKEVSAFENSTENSVEPVLTDIPENFKAYCYTCESEVSGRNVFHHLFFGTLDCKLCSFKILNCQKFQNVYKVNMVPCKDSKTGGHEFKWHQATPDYLSYVKLKELSIERFCSNQNKPPSFADVSNAVGLYIMTLSVLENHQPWKLGFENCRRYPKLATLVSEFKKSLDSKVNESESGVQLEGGSKSLSSDKSCDNNIIPQQEVLSKKRTNDRDCIPAKQLGIELSESAVDKVSEEEQSIDDNQLSITDAFSIPKSSELVQNEHFPESFNSITNSNESPLRTDLANSSKDSISLPQGKKFSKPLVSDCSLVIPEQNLFDYDPDDPDEVLLQSCSIEKLDQAVEYVTVDDASEKAITPVTEEQESLLHAVIGEDGKEGDNLSGKRRASDMTVDGVKCKSKLLKKCHNSYHKSSFMDFEPPDKIPGDHYLVIHYPSQGCPEECPNCYCEFCPSMLTVNCSTYVSTIICADCKLTIYVLPD